MKKVKTIVSTCLILCLCLSMMTLFCSAAESRAVTTVICQGDGVYFRKSIEDLSDTDEIIGQFSRGDKMNVFNELTAVWYYGTAGTQTAIFAEFGSIKGYANSAFFNIY